MPSESLESYSFTTIDFSDVSERIMINTDMFPRSSSASQEYDWYLLGESLEERRIRQIKNVKV